MRSISVITASVVAGILSPVLVISTLALAAGGPNQGPAWDSTFPPGLAGGGPATGTISLTGTTGATTGLVPPTCELLTFAANPGDASKTTSGLIADGVQLWGISSRVITAGTNCTSVDLGDGADADLFADDTAVTANSTSDNSDATANWSNPQIAAGEVTVTGVGGNCFDLAIRVCAHYATVGAPTS
jgi:hypothetical protein